MLYLLFPKFDQLPPWDLAAGAGHVEGVAGRPATPAVFGEVRGKRVVQLAIAHPAAVLHKVERVGFHVSTFFHTSFRAGNYPGNGLPLHRSSGWKLCSGMQWCTETGTESPAASGVGHSVSSSESGVGLRSAGLTMRSCPATPELPPEPTSACYLALLFPQSGCATIEQYNDVSCHISCLRWLPSQYEKVPYSVRRCVSDSHAGRTRLHKFGESSLFHLSPLLLVVPPTRLDNPTRYRAYRRTLILA